MIKDIRSFQNSIERDLKNLRAEISKAEKTAKALGKTKKKGGKNETKKTNKKATK